MDKHTSKAKREERVEEVMLEVTTLKLFNLYLLLYARVSF